MITKEELVNTYINYSSDITEEIFNKIIDKLESLGFEKYYLNNSRNKDYKYFVEKSFSYLRIDCKYWFIGSFDAGYKEIQVSDILEEDNQFEVGKWYKVPETSNYIVKYKSNNICSEYITNKGLYNNFRGGCNYKNAKEVPLTEIQQYLPDGHPDKIVKKFVLPEKWCIKSTNDTIKVINDFIKSKGYEHSLVYDIYYIHYPFLNEKYSAYTSIQDGYTEITFDQFKQHVLKERVEEVKSIEKWYVGSYIVPLQDRLLSRTDFLTKGKPYEITKLILGRIPYIIANSGDEINFKTDFKDAEATQGIKWFPTLTEAEAFSKSLLEPKPLTVDDLIEGEIYSGVIIGGGVIIFIPNECELFNNYDDIPNSFKKNNTPKNVKNIKLATPEEKQWLNVCISENKFIEKDYALRGYDMYGKVLKSEVTKPVNKPFEFNKWHKSNNADGLFFIQSKNTGYGFRSNHVNYWFTNNADFEWNIDGLEPATNEEVQERLLNYAKEKYPVGTKFKSIAEDTNYIVDGDPVNWVSSNWPDGIGNFGFGMLYGKGQWADIISKPESKESKEMQLFNLKNPVFNIGDKVRVIADSLREFNSSWTNGNNANYKKGYVGIVTKIEETKSGHEEVNRWCYLEGNASSAISCNLLELVEPVKKEFDRNWYVEVNSQEEADKVFQYLESIGERIVSDESFSRKYLPDVGTGYKYIYYIGNAWFLGENPRNIPQKQLSDILPDYSLEPKIDRDVYYEVSNQEEYEEIISKVKKSIEF